MNSLEAARRLGDSGPVIEEGVLVGDGLSTGTIEEARQAMEGDPLIKRSLRTFGVRKSEMREGRIDISVRASVGRYFALMAWPAREFELNKHRAY